MDSSDSMGMVLWLALAVLGAPSLAGGNKDCPLDSQPWVILLYTFSSQFFIYHPRGPMADSSWRQVIGAAIGTHKATGRLLSTNRDRKDTDQGATYNPPGSSAPPQQSRPISNNHRSFSNGAYNGYAPSTYDPQYSHPLTSPQH